MDSTIDASVGALVSASVILGAVGFAVNHYKYAIIDKCLDLYVSFFHKGKSGTAVDSPPVEPSFVKDGVPVWMYTRDGVNYVALHKEPSSKQPLDPPEKIESITVTFHDETGDTDHQHVRDIVERAAGHLCDFHGHIPNLADLDALTGGRLQNVKRVTVNTTYWQEYVLVHK